MNKKGNDLSVLGVRDQAHTAQGKWYRQKVVARTRLNTVTFHKTQPTLQPTEPRTKYSYITIMILLLSSSMACIGYLLGFISNIGRCIINFKKCITL